MFKFELTSAASATDAVIQKKIFGSGMTALIISNEEMEDIMEIVKSLEESGLLIEDMSEIIKNEIKEQKGGFIVKLSGTLDSTLLGSMLAGKGVIKVREGMIRAGQDISG